ncbi:MAG: ribonuclease HI family protein [Deltaproteobacteria bacterium]|nr:ribonuclease HI family protein [Deltaproteobacteria bacterium]
MADGGSRGNPGPAGAGAVLLDPDGREVAALSRFLGRVTNNVAEYQALLLGLTEAQARGVRELEIKMDSELVVRQLQGTYRVKNPGLQPLYRQAKELLRQFAAVHIMHVRREFNSRADELANQAMDRRG